MRDINNEREDVFLVHVQAVSCDTKDSVHAAPLEVEPTHTQESQPALLLKQIGRRKC